MKRWEMKNHFPIFAILVIEIFVNQEDFLSLEKRFSETDILVGFSYWDKRLLLSSGVPFTACQISIWFVFYDWRIPKMNLAMPCYLLGHFRFPLPSTFINVPIFLNLDMDVQLTNTSGLIFEIGSPLLNPLKKSNSSFIVQFGWNLKLLMFVYQW